MSVAFFNAISVLHMEFIAPSQTVKAACYEGVLDRLVKLIARVTLYFLA